MLTFKDDTEFGEAIAKFCNATWEVKKKAMWTLPGGDRYHTEQLVSLPVAEWCIRRLKKQGWHYSAEKGGMYVFSKGSTAAYGYAPVADFYRGILKAALNTETAAFLEKLAPSEE